jgi:hypothetical protein
MLARTQSGADKTADSRRRVRAVTTNGVGKLCTRCHANPRRSPSQRWCLACHNASRRVQPNGRSEIHDAFPTRQKPDRERQGTLPGQNGTDWMRPPIPAPDLQPLPSVADKWSGWQGAYLRHLVATGQRVRGCAIAGISRRELQAALDANPDFREAVDTALGEYADGLAVGLVETGRRRENPVGTIVALKALRPLEYIERSASLAVSLDMTERSPITEAAAVKLLKGMLGHMTESTKLRVLDAPMPEMP